MIVDVAEANSARSTPTMSWAPLAIAAEALVVLLVTALVVQLKFTSFGPRILLLLSSSFSFLLHKDKIAPGYDKKAEALDAIDLPIDCLDHESARRKTRSIYQNKIFETLSICPDNEVIGLKITEKYVVNSRGIEIFTKRWTPESAKPKAGICYCHGYGDTCTFFFEGVARKLASNNFAVFAMDYAGFGLSQGLHGYITSFDQLVADVTEYYASINEEEEFNGLPLYLMGESMGGAVALKAHFSQPQAWNGAILIAPMCKIADDMTPPWLLVQILKALARIIPKAKLVPSGDIAEIGFHDLEKRKRAKQNLIAYSGKPRLYTAVNLLRATEQIEQQLGMVSLPLLVLHGALDRVTDPAVSQALYLQASTTDKEIHLYENAWHAVLEGEPEETVDQAIGDIVTWLDAHVASES